MPTKVTHPLSRLCLVMSIAATVAAAGAAGAAGPFDGTYKGSETVQLNNNYQGCSNRTDIVLIIQNSHFTRRWYDTQFGVDVASDGTFSRVASFEAGRNRRANVSITEKLSAPVWRLIWAATVVRCIYL